MDCHKNKCPPPNCSGKFNIYSNGCFAPLQQPTCSVYVQRPPYPPCPQPPCPQPPCPQRSPYEHFPPQYPPQYSQYPSQHPPQHQTQYPPQQASSTQSVDRDKLQHQHQFQQQQQLQQIQQQQQHQQQLQQIQQQQLQQQLQQIQQQLHHQLSQQSTFPVLPPLPPIPPLPKLEVPPLPPLPYLSSNPSTCKPRRCRSPSPSPPSSPCSPPSDTQSTVPSIQILPYPLGYTPPPGTILHNTTTCLPPGYLECNGADILRIEYATLFSMIGIYYGEGDAYTTFSLPNLQNKNTKPYQYIIRYDLQEVPTIVIKPHLEVIDVKVQGVDTICFS